MTAWWNTLAPRERLLVAWGGVLALALLYALLIWLPLRDEHARLLGTVARQQQTLAVLEEMAPEVTRLRRPQSLSPADVREGLKRQGLTAQTVSQEGKDAVRVKLQPAPFDTVAAWLATLEESGQMLAELHVQRGEGEALTGVELVVSGGK